MREEGPTIPNQRKKIYAQVVPEAPNYNKQLIKYKYCATPIQSN